MIILSAGMPRAGSGWHYNLTHDLMTVKGAVDARQIRDRYRLGSILTEVNCNIGVLSLRRLSMVMIPSLLGNDFVIKVHSGLTPFARLLVRVGQLRPTYIYRDPRDALLSAYEYGQRAVEKGRPNAFSHLDTIEKAIGFFREYVEDWNGWMACGRCHRVSYEALKSDFTREAPRLAQHLGLDPEATSVQLVYEKYRPGQAKSGDRGLHFHKGVSGRFREVLSSEQQQTCLDLYGTTLLEMGYRP